MATHSSILTWRIPMERVSWWATVHRFTKSRTQLKQLSTHTHKLLIIILWILHFICRSKWQPTPVLLPGESHGQRSLVDYSSRGRKESDRTERVHLLSLFRSKIKLSWCIYFQQSASNSSSFQWRCILSRSAIPQAQRNLSLPSRLSLAPHSLPTAFLVSWQLLAGSC